jgi:hypothetical protein
MSRSCIQGMIEFYVGLARIWMTYAPSRRDIADLQTSHV